MMQRLKSIGCLALVVVISANATTLGSGSYRDGLPSGTAGPVVNNRVTSDFTGHPNTNDWSSSVNFPFFNGAFSAPLFAYPLIETTEAGGLVLGYKTGAGVHTNGYIWGYAAQLRLGVEGLNASEVRSAGHGDWTQALRWEGGGKRLDAMVGHGLPFAYCRISGGNAKVEALDAPQVWSNQGNALGITVQGMHYGLFAPSGATWSQSGNSFTSGLAGKGYYSVALLPDNSLVTLEEFRGAAYTFVTGSTVAWDLDEGTSMVSATYSLATEAMEGSPAAVPQALLRHQWLQTSAPLRADAYKSPRGAMALTWGSSFTTSTRFEGILPAFPVAGLENQADRDKLSTLLATDVAALAGNPFPSPDTYFGGKELAKIAQLVRLAQDLGRTDTRDQLLGWLRNQLQDWLTYSGDSDARFFAYDPRWHQLVGVPASFNSNDQINDHHFHYGYFVQAAAVIAQFTPGWADQWGAMVNLLIRDANGPDHADPLFPALRNFDPYEGHSWASGHGAFGDGNNQESISEGWNYNAGVFLWGMASGNAQMRDLGAYLFTTERIAGEQYWFDIDNAVFPAEWSSTSTSIVWGGKSDYATWFSGEAEMIQGIIMLPISWHSLSLCRRPDYCAANYANLVARNGGPENDWVDVIWQYQAFFDPAAAMAKWVAHPSYAVEQGETRTKTFFWLAALRDWGTTDTTLWASSPTAVVFAKGSEKRYVAWNSSAAVQNVVFSDGLGMTLQPGELALRKSSEMVGGLVVAVEGSSRGPGLFDGTASEGMSGASLVQTARGLLVGSLTAGELQLRDARGVLLGARRTEAGHTLLAWNELPRGASFASWRGSEGSRRTLRLVAPR